MPVPKGLPATEPVSIMVAEVKLTKNHQLQCDICNKKIRLKESAHPHWLFEHV